MLDIHGAVVHQYAVQWEQLGLKLGLQQCHIDIISANNAYNPERLPACCKEVFKKWLEIDSSATWGKLDDVINSLNIAPLSFGYKGTYVP